MDLKVLVLLLMMSYRSAALKNVLFLVADDMRQQLGVYQQNGAPTCGDCFPSSISPNMITPNLDKLAKTSLLLKRAYVQQALCGPSRTSVLTGRRPDTTRVYDLTTYWRTYPGNANYTSIPQYFKENGYKSLGMGKIYHKKATDNFDPPSWSEEFWRGKANFEDKVNSWKAIKDSLLKDQPLVDMQIASHAIETLNNMTKDNKFFFAVGFKKPHLPFVMPKSYLRMYPRSNISLPNNPYVPEDVPDAAWFKWPELRQYEDINVLNQTGEINDTLPNNKVKDLRRAYYATITYVDAQVGRVLDALKASGHENNTVVVFWSDHGFKLGEHGGWCKSTNFELDTHVPLMIRVPGQTDAGISSTQHVELVDLFPTLVEAAGLPQLPQCNLANSTSTVLCTEGISLLPLISSPNTPIKKAAFSQTTKVIKTQFVMGYTIRTSQYRYTEWVAFNKTTSTPDWNNSYGKELYDHNIDVDENKNRAAVASYNATVADLSTILRAGWVDAIL